MSTPPKPPIARNLRRLKEDRCHTQRDIALAVGVDVRLVQMWLSDDGSDPSWPNVLALAHYFGVKPEWFYTEDAEVPA